MHSAEKASTKAEKDYKNSVDKQKSVDKTYYQKLCVLMSSLEKMDRKRISAVTSILQRYAYLQEQLWKKLEDTSDKLKEATKNVEEDKEILDFINATKSNTQPPPPAAFEPYVVSVHNIIYKKIQCIIIFCFII